MAKAVRVGRDWGWLGGMLWGPRVEGLLRSAWKPRDNSVERAGAVSGAARARSAVFRAQGLWRRCSRLSPTCTGPWNTHPSYQRDTVFTSLGFLGGPLLLLWIIDLVIILYYFILILNKVCHHYWRKLF